MHVRTRNVILAITTVLAGTAMAAFAIAWHPAIPLAATPSRASLDPARIARGAELAAIGDCAVCHTAPGGRPLAGGRGVPTPFGTVVSTNITPDPANGIGGWSEAAFRRAMRDGIARDGSHLYPVLPYPHFTRATDDDIGALYAFLATRAPVATAPVPNLLPFPFNQRVTLAGWNLLFLRPGPWQPDPARDAEWNRGAYLAEAVGHCGACHTPHNPLGAERNSRSYAGGQAEDWPAPALQADNPAPRPWTDAALATYLATGYHPDHGAAAGPMTAVTRQLANVPDADVRALAHYFAAMMPQAPAALPPAAPPPAAPAPAADGQPPSQAFDPVVVAMFNGACGSCHAGNAPMIRNGAASLALSTAVNAPGPDGTVQAILNGIPWRDDGAHGGADHYMPAYADALTDAQVAALAAYTRARFTARPAWTGIEGSVAKARGGGS